MSESLDSLRREIHEAHHAMCAALAPRVLRLEVDGEVVTIRFERDAVVEVARPARVSVALRTSRAAILSVIDGRHSLVSAVLAGLLDLTGRPVDVAAFHDGFVSYLQGGVRAPSFPRLLEGFRAFGAQGVV